MTRSELPSRPDFEPFEKTINEVAQMNSCSESLNRVVASVLPTANIRRPWMAERTKSFLGSGMRIACAVMSAAMIAVWLFFQSPGSSIAFAQVQEQVKQTKTVRYVEYMSETEARRAIEQARSLWVHQRADAAKKHAEMAIESMERDLNSGTPIPARRVWIQGRYLQRVEHARKQIELFNAETGESVILHPDTKRCITMKSQTVLEMHSGKQLVKEIKPLPEADLYAQIASLPAAELKSLPEKDIGGISVIGFEQSVINGSHHAADIVRTYWINKATGLPVRIEAVVLKDGNVVGGTYCTDFVFDEVFEPELFDMSPPEDYTVTEGGFISIEPTK